MHAYPDISFLFSLHAPQSQSPIASAYFATMKVPPHLTSMSRFELLNAIQHALFRKMIEKSAGVTGTGKTGCEQCQQRPCHLQCDWAAVHGRSLQIARQYTGKGGYRGSDILHVATALELGAKEFLTFDAKQSLM
jgi:hypothetical protein